MIYFIYSYLSLNPDGDNLVHHLKHCPKEDWSGKLNLFAICSLPNVIVSSKRFIVQNFVPPAWHGYAYTMAPLCHASGTTVSSL